MEDQLTPDDMSNFFGSFKIYPKLYTRWKDCAKYNHKSMKGMLSELLHSCSPGCYYIPEPDETDTWWTCPNKEYMEFTLDYTRPLQEEIFTIFKQTGYKNNSIEMNKEILERLNRALYLRRF